MNSLCTEMESFVFTSGENSAGEVRELRQKYLPACEVCNGLNISVSVVRDDWKFGPSRVTPPPLAMSLPSWLSHCRTGLADNPSKFSVTIQWTLRLWPKLGADTALVEMLIAVLGTKNNNNKKQKQDIVNMKVPAVACMILYTNNCEHPTIHNRGNVQYAFC